MAAINKNTMELDTCYNVQCENCYLNNGDGCVTNMLKVWANKECD